MYKVIDLFAGAGGLSLGFVQTGKFNIVVAAENNKNAQLTYKKNHPNVDVRDDVRDIDYYKLIEECGDIDVVIGGPPCQGFSNANRQKAQTISSNNSLVKEYVRAICELQPKAFVMENVGMLRSDIHRFYYSEKDKNIPDSLKRARRKDNLEIISGDYCFGNEKAVASTLCEYNDRLWKDKEYLAVNVLFRQKKNKEKFDNASNKYKKCLLELSKRLLQRTDSADIVAHAEYGMAQILREYYAGDATRDELLRVIEAPLMYQRMYKCYSELVANEIVIDGYEYINGVCAKVTSYPVYEYVKAILESPPYCYDIKSAVLNAAEFGAPQKRERYVIVGTKEQGKALLPEGKFSEGNYRTVRDAINDLEDVPTYFNVTTAPRKLLEIKIAKGSLLEQLRDSSTLYNHVITETRETAMKRFKALKQGDNFHDLDKSLKTTYTDEKRTQNTIYLRLKYDEPSGTVVNVRKSMWVHPTKDRALSIREAARLQTFPDSFVFQGTKDAQYQQVGNAVPPILARAIAETIASILQEL